MRKKIVAGNWKMNTGIQDARALVDGILNDLPQLASHQQVVFCPPYIHISRVNGQIQDSGKSQVFCGAQNCHDKASGAFTGEISIPMLKEIGVTHVIIGHSERRQYFAESHDFLKSKVDALVEAGMQVIFCCGEPLEVREAESQNDFVAQQLKDSLMHLNAEVLQNQVIIAYEPIWAIGTGKTASSNQAQEMHAYIRALLAKQYGADTANEISILYGGSCNAANAAELFACPDVDGGLIGGAALKAETFLPIIQALP
jgi:triosephosphate isomerase